MLRSWRIPHSWKSRKLTENNLKRKRCAREIRKVRESGYQLYTLCVGKDLWKRFVLSVWKWKCMRVTMMSGGECALPAGWGWNWWRLVADAMRDGASCNDSLTRYTVMTTTCQQSPASHDVTLLLRANGENIAELIMTWLGRDGRMCLWDPQRMVLRHFLLTGRWRISTD